MHCDECTGWQLVCIQCAKNRTNVKHNGTTKVHKWCNTTTYEWILPIKRKLLNAVGMKTIGGPRIPHSNLAHNIFHMFLLLTYHGTSPTAMRTRGASRMKLPVFCWSPPSPNFREKMSRFLCVVPLHEP